MTDRIVIKDLGKVFANGTVALRGIDLRVADGEFVSIIGPSGCGKTTLLRLMAGLERPTSGSVDVVASTARPNALPTAMVFQEHALFPWMRVLDNVEFAFQSLSVPGKARRERAMEQLTKVGLSTSLQAFPNQLSGGMRQRVSIARAFAVDPLVLFMDEPFGALDEQTRLGLGTALLSLWEENRKTVLFITHSIEEAIALSDRIVVLDAHPGRIREIVNVDLARPRDLIALKEDQSFGHLASRLWGLLGPGTPDVGDD